MSDKQCSKCKQRKPVSEFYKNKAQADGLSAYCKACHSDYISTYREENRDKVNQWGREQTARDREKRIAEGWKPKRQGEESVAHKKEYSKQWREKNRSWISNWWKQWRKENPEKARDLDRKNKYRRRHAEGSFTEEEFRDLCERYGNRCLRCGRDDVPLTPDHVIPIAKGGHNTIDNLQPLCLSCNASKKDKTIDYR